MFARRMIREALVAVALAVVAGAGGCRKSAPTAPPPQEAVLPPIEILKDGRWLFTYVEPEGGFATTDKPAAVPEGARKLVRVIDPSQGAMERRDRTSVYVVDLNELLSAGKVRARVLSREAYETAALAQLPPGESSALADGRHAAPEAEPAAGTDAKATVLPPGTAPVVTVYGTSWCGACRAAREYLAAKKIPFADKDVERDPAAARELSEKAARLGVPADRVPILDVRGRLLIGFDKARLEALLGEAT